MCRPVSTFLYRISTIMLFDSFSIKDILRDEKNLIFRVDGTCLHGRFLLFFQVRRVVVAVNGAQTGKTDVSYERNRR